MNNEELNKNVDMQEQETEEYIEENTADEIMGQIAVQEELKRIDKQDIPAIKTPKDIKNKEVYKEIMTQAHTIGECFQTLLGYGIDYTNAVAISNNLIQNQINIETAKIQQVNMQNNQL